MKKVILFFVVSILLQHNINSNNVVVTNVSTTGQDVSAGPDNVNNFTKIQFDISWDNSWRLSSGPSNWDAVWVFAKFQITGGTGCTASNTWYHATLSTNPAHHTITNNNGVPATITPSSDGKGVFMYRSGNGTGSIDWDGVQLRWNYGADMAVSGIKDGCTVTIKVFAIEMVYIPQGAFFAGDGTTTNIRGQFTNAATTNAFQITGEGALTLGGGGAGSLGNNNASGMGGGADDFNNTTSQTLPAAFPKGFNAYYIMKYECSNEQYADFLNTLSATQQAARCVAIVAGAYMCNTASTMSPQNRNAVKCKIAPSGSVPGEYGCDLNNNGVYNEAADGRFIALNWASSGDFMAYLDWACLRPMTELEYEKACRGNQAPVANEYAWGNTTLHPTSYAALSNPGASNELPFNPSTAAGNCAYSTTANVVGIQGPLRCGIFATSTSTRVSAGASYYGVMELSGNVWELAVGVGSVAGRSYTGLHGNGYLNAAGAADVDYWPGMNNNNTVTVANGVYAGIGCTGYAGLGFRGGAFWDNAWLRVSDRDYSVSSAWGGLSVRDRRTGIRGVRTAP